MGGKNHETVSFDRSSGGGALGWSGGGNEALAQVNFQVANISNNAFNNYTPDINDRGQAVWSGNGQIYYFDTRWDPSTQSPVNISNSASSANYPKINNKGQVVWVAGGEIYYYNLTWDSATQNPVNISNSAFSDWGPRINDKGQVVWWGYGGPGGTVEIYAYDLSWDPATHTPMNISNNNFNDNFGGLEINDQGQVVWGGRGGTGGSSEVYYYDLSWSPGALPQQITHDNSVDNNIWEHDCKINNKGQIVWYARYHPTDPTAAYYSEIYYYDLSWAPGTLPRNISNQWGYDVHPQISDQGQVVWILSVPYVQEIMYYDLSWAPGTAPKNISNTPFHDTWPKINNKGQVCWVNWPAREIYYYDLSWAPATPAQYLASGINGNSDSPYEGFKINDLGQVIYVNGTSGDGGGQIYLATPFTWVTIDIKPGEEPNSINLGSNGKVPVAILSSPTFDASAVDPASVTLAGAQVALKGKGEKYMAAVSDVNGDGLPDLIVHVDTTAFQLSAGDTEAVLEGKTNAGLCIRGTDTVRIVP
jgi:hypothetical protein